MAEFLLEIGTEEIPARMLRKAEADLKTAVEALFKENNIHHEPLMAYGAPRQLTLYSTSVTARQEDRVETVLGPPVRIAYDAEGKPGRALDGFLRKNPALDANNLIRVTQEKGEVVAGRLEVEGRNTVEILAENLPQILDKMHFAKNMRWGHCPTRFVRPVRSILALFDGAVIPFTFGGMATGNESFGHRFCGAARFPITGIDHYFSEKEKQGIMVRHEDRVKSLENRIADRLEEVGGKLVPDDSLLEEVSDLLELPYVVLGSFDKMFLEIPKEVLITSLRDHQKSFCVQDGNGNLMPYFLAFASVAGDVDGLIRKGNEWVLNARLYDAKFFWEADLKKNFETLRLKLKNQTFHNKIGSYYEKTERIARLAGSMASQLDWSGSALDDLDYAARHCKTDLVSELVFEFPELQGITGGLLLARKGMPDTIAHSIYDCYLPISMEDALPRTKTGAIISLADKLDTLVGCFAVGLIPTGTKDPYALRRAAQGIVRLLIEHELPLSLDALITASLSSYEDVVALPADLANTLREFFLDRLRYYFKRLNVDHKLVGAVLATDADRVDQTNKRLKAIEAQMTKTSFSTLAQNLKRMKNVVADELDQLPAFNIKELTETAERELWTAYEAVKPDIERAVAAREYNKAMDLMVSLAPPVEVYFSTDGVFINVEDVKLRHNRKAMIRAIGATLTLVGDISYLG